MNKMKLYLHLNKLLFLNILPSKNTLIYIYISCGSFFQAIRSEQKILVIKMYKAKKAKDPKILYKQMINELMAETGIGKTSIQKMISEYNKNKTISSPNMTKIRPKLVEKIDDRDKNAIRQKVHQFWHDREPPTMEKVLKAVTADDSLPTLKRTSMYRLLKDLNFEFTKRKRSGVVLTEREDLIVRRRKYLRSIRSCREDGRPLYYVAETWCDAAAAGGPSRKSRAADDAASAKTSDSGASRRKEPPTSAACNGDKGCPGKRLVAVHIGSRDGFVDGGLLCFESSKASNGCGGGAADFQSEMNGDSFLKWFENVLPMLPDDAVIVTDSTPYNSAKVDTIPVTSWKKANVMKWLHEKDVRVDDSYVKPELFDLVKRHEPALDKYIVDEVARAANKTVLRLPPYHRELNAMELAWSVVKSRVNNDGAAPEIGDVVRSLVEGIGTVTAENWRHFEEQTVREEAKLWELDRMVDDFLENDDYTTCVFTFGTSDTSSSDTDF